MITYAFTREEIEWDILTFLYNSDFLILYVAEYSMIPQYLQMNMWRYDQLDEHGFIHKSINHSQKEYVNGIVHVNNCCECRRSNLYQL